MLEPGLTEIIPFISSSLSCIFLHPEILSVYCREWLQPGGCQWDRRRSASWLPLGLRSSRLESQNHWWLWQPSLLIWQERLHFFDLHRVLRPTVLIFLVFYLGPTLFYNLFTTPLHTCLPLPQMGIVSGSLLGDSCRDVGMTWEEIMLTKLPEHTECGTS